MRRRVTRRCSPSPRPYPFLVFFHGKNMKNQTFYCLSEPNTTYDRSIPELQNKRVWLSSHGWLVLSANFQFHLWNPTTLESIYLPPLHLQPKQSVESILLTSSPANPGSTLMLFVLHPQNIIFCSIKDQTWITRGYHKDIKVIGENDGGDHLTLPVVCNDKIYATTFRRGNLVEIGIVKQKSLVIRALNFQIPFVQSVWGQRNRYLVESTGDLYMINTEIYHGDIMNIVVLKLDFSTMVWDKVESCPDKAFFLTNGEAISCPTAETDLDRIGNRVYFTLRQDKSLYTYHIEDKTISMSLPCPNVPTPWSTPIWVFPDGEHHRRSGEKEKANGKKEDGQGDIQVRQGNCEIIEAEKLEEANRTLLNDLCADIGRRIAKHFVSPFDYMNFRAVSQWCRSIAPAKQWTTLSPSVVELESQILSPWLMFPSTTKGVTALLDPRLCVGKYYVTIPQAIEDSLMCYSKDGWVLMSNFESLTLYNPLTKSIICLPDLPPLDQTYFFTSLPDSSKSIVVAISFCPAMVSLTRPGMSEWIHIELIREEEEEEAGVYFKNTHTYPVFLNDCFYFLGGNDCLGVVKLEESYTTLAVHKMKKPCSSYQENFLVECGGEILAIFVGRAGKWVQVFKLNPLAMAWEEVKSLGKYTLYLCYLSTVAVEAKTPEMENKIYFPRFYNESMVYYCLETGKFHCSDSKDTLTNFYGTKKQSSCCCWVEPRWHSRESTHSSSSMLEELITL